MIKNDLIFLIIASLSTIFLTIFNYPSVIKSLSSSKLATIQIKQAARQFKLEDAEKPETDFWESIKEIEFNYSKQNTDSSTAQKTRFLEPVQQQTIKSTEVKKKKEKPLTRFLLVGDSIMYTFGIEFENAAKKSNFKFDKIKIESRHSTGLNRIDYFDWYARTSELIYRYNPDAIVVLFGGNDDQIILDKDGKYRAKLTPKWKEAYQQRVENYAQLLNESSVKKVYWIGHPTSNIPRHRRFLSIVNQIYQKVSQTYPKIKFIDNWHTFAVNGNFNAIVANKSGKKGRVRTKDVYHFTNHGAKILVDNLIETMNEDGVLQKK